jgi:ParB family chromosome partitioning protein
LGRLIGIDIAAWWRPTAANFFDRVSKQVILAAIGEAGGPELAARFASAKKGDLAASAERIFAGSFITEAEVKERALGWIPAAMRFASVEAAQAEPAEDGSDDAMTSPQPDNADPDEAGTSEATAPSEGDNPAPQAALEMAA